tara:strand:+ start:4844 stop:5257 length:414 start_codon:yes stop_codon:yes gene_type:complete
MLSVGTIRIFRLAYTLQFKIFIKILGGKMGKKGLATFNFKNLSKKNPALFSLAEIDTHYLVAVDIPSIPAIATQIVTTKKQLLIESQKDNSGTKEVIFRAVPRGKGIKTIYLNGVLYLLLPKFGNQHLNLQTLPSFR